MQENFKINVKLTLKDIKNMSRSKAYSSVLSKISLIFSVILGTIMITGVISVALLIPNNRQINEMLLIAVFMTIFFIGINNFRFILIYFSEISNFRKSKLLSNLQCYEFMDSGVKISSSNGSFSTKWSDICKVQELKSCFLIFTSPVKYFIIPRRCFNSDQQLDIFFSILVSRVDSKKLKLKKYKIRDISPDYGEVRISESVQTIEEDCLVHLFEINFSHSKSEIIKINYSLYYTRPTGIIITGIGILFGFTYFRNLFYEGSSILAPLVISIIFTILMPIVIYTNTKSGYEKDEALKKPYTYKFYPDYFIIIHSSGTTRIRWADLVKVIELKSAFLLFGTTRIAHIIPKRVFEDKNKEYEMFRGIISEKFPRIKK